MATIRFGTSLDSLGIPNVQNTLNNFAATSAPTASDDSTAGYSVGSVWVDVNTDTSYTCVDATPGSAIWNEQSDPGSSDYAGKFESATITVLQIPSGKWGWWWDTVNSRLFNVRNRSGVLYAVEATVI